MCAPTQPGPTDPTGERARRHPFVEILTAALLGLAAAALVAAVVADPHLLGAVASATSAWWTGHWPLR